MRRGISIFSFDNSRLSGIWIIAGLLFLAAASYASEPEHPPISAGVPFFYYEDLKTAADWYENKLGLKRVLDEGWVVIFELTPTSYIGLVNAADGFLQPQEEKSAMLSIETETLQSWYQYLKSVEGVNISQDIGIGGKGLIKSFMLTDPGGYAVEFFMWRNEKDDPSEN